MHLLLLILLATAGASAQTYTESVGWRLNAGLSFNSHSGAVHTTGGVIDCGDLPTGSGIGPAFSLGAEIPLSTSFGFGIEAGYTGRSGTFSRVNSYPLRTFTGDDVTLLANYAFEATLGYIDFAPTFFLPLIGTFHKRTLGVSVGPRLSLPLAKSYVQRETVSSPDNAYFIVDGNRAQERVISQGELLSPSSMLLGISGSIESFISVSEHIALIPRISADYFFTNVATDAEWKLLSIRAEIGIRFSKGVTKQQAAAIAPVAIDAAPAPPSISLDIYGFSGVIVTGNQLRASTPVVNAVFFDSASADVPVSYRRSFDGSVMSTHPVEAHAWILQHIASIVKANPRARVLLQGATSGGVSEPEGVSLAARRAESVRRILAGMGVPSSSISVKSAVLPQIPSNGDFAAGREENRRVDLVVENAPLQKWVSAEEFAFARGTVKIRARFIGGGAGSKPNSTTISLNGIDTVVSTAGIEHGIRCELPIRVDQKADTIIATASAGGAYSQRDTVVDLTTLPRRSVTLQAMEFDAVLRFDYNSSDVTQDVQSLLTQLAEQLPANSTIIIEGSADALGSEERNRVLSEQRADKTELLVKSVANKSLNFRTSITSEKFSNETPQGRFLNRSIRVRVQTP